MILRFEYRTKDGKLLDGISGGNLTYTIANSVKSAGKIKLTEPWRVGLQDRSRWLDEEISITAFKDDYPIPLGVFVPSLPESTFTTGALVTEIDLLDRLTVLDQDLYERTFSVGAGGGTVSPLGVVNQILGDWSNLTAYSNINYSQFNINRYWEPGTSKLKIINDLLDVSGHFSLWVDGRGNFHVDGLTEPLKRPVTQHFDYGGLNELKSRKQDLFSVPNKFIAVGESQESAAALVGTAYNRDANSPFSYQNRGRWIAEIEQGVVGATQDILDAYALQRLDSLTGASTTYTVEHILTAPLLNARVQVDHAPLGINEDFVVQRIEVPLDSTKLTKSTIREITGGIVNE